MYRVFQHEDGSLYVKIESENLKGIFQLQIVHSINQIIDAQWFEKAVDDKVIREYSLPPAFDSTPIEIYEEYEESYEIDEYDTDYDYDVPPGYMDDCPEGVDPDNWRESYTGG